MAIQLSSYLSFRNNELMFLINPENRNHDYVPRNFSDEDRSKLKKIIDEIDSLHEPLSDVYHDETPVEGEHVLLTRGETKILERSTNREKSGRLFGQIHRVLRKYDFRESMFIDIYCHLGNAFSEIGLNPTKEIKRAVAYAENLRNNYMNYSDGSTPVFWDNVLEPKQSS